MTATLGEALHELHDELLLAAARERVGFFVRVARRIDSAAVERRLVAAYDRLVEVESASDD
jgi:hypothetical protein